MTTPRCEWPTDDYCAAVLDGCPIPGLWWNPGMEETRRLLGGRCTTRHLPVVVTACGAFAHKGCWLNDAHERGGFEVVA